MSENQQPSPPVTPLNPIRVETAISRYPVHRLARKGSIKIEVIEEQGSKDTALAWKVSYNSDYGQPGPLAYKLDTLIINRRIEEASRPIQRLIKLGSLHDICRELGVSEGKNIVTIKNALHQNASAYIQSRIHYKLADGTERTLEAGFTRYSVIFTGEKLPNGKKADGVFIVLNDTFMQVLSGAMTRPLDYDYLKSLPPGPQRFYELLSYQMYAALKYDRARAKLTYSEFCSHAPQTRHVDWAKVRSQMNKIHRPHLQSGYIIKVDFQDALDSTGQPDWIMNYMPGPKARAEFRAFTKRGGPTVIEVEPFTEDTIPLLTAPEPSPLERELIDHGITPATATELTQGFSEDQIRKQLDYVEWLTAKKPEKVSDMAGYVVDAIRKGYTAPKGFISKAERQRQQDAKAANDRKDAEARRQKHQADARERAEKQLIDDQWKALPAAELATLDATVLAAADMTIRQTYETMKADGLGSGYLASIRREYLKKRLQADGKLPPDAE